MKTPLSSLFSVTFTDTDHPALAALFSQPPTFVLDFTFAKGSRRIIAAIREKLKGHSAPVPMKLSFPEERTIQVSAITMNGRKIWPLKQSEKKPEPAGTWWCNSHGREATHMTKNGRRCCDPNLDGILLPCNAVLAPMTVKRRK